MINFLGKMLSIFLVPFVYVAIMAFTVKSVWKHIRFFNKYHPNMDKDTRHDRIVENVVNDLRKLKRDLGIPDRPSNAS